MGAGTVRRGSERRGGHRIARVWLCLGISVAGLTVLPAHAASPGLSGPAYGVVDLGDTVAYAVGGSRCADRSVRIEAKVARRVVAGPRSWAGSESCTGKARVPSFAALRAVGWRQGDALELALVSGRDRVPLRYQRLEVDRSVVAAGTPTTVPGDDPDTGPRDAVVAVSTGDVVDLGRANLDGIDSIAIRLCLLGNKNPVSPGYMDVEVPARLSLRQLSPSGPDLVSDVDVSDNPTTWWTRQESVGFGPSCWRLVTLPITGQPVESAPRLFLAVELAVPGTLKINSIDLNGTGARDPQTARWASPDPIGMRRVFDGRSFRGWTQSGCALRDGAATNVRTGGRTDTAGCTMTYGRAATNQVLRLEVRRRSFFDNGAIQVPNEVQLRSAGEFLPGGYQGEAAARWQKLNAWPAWSQLEIVQLGARYVVRVNGRTVTDHIAQGGAPGKYQIRISAQPMYSYRAGVEVGFGQETGSPLPSADEWGDFWFRDVRVYQCRSLTDPACTSLATLNEGQTPRV